MSTTISPILQKMFKDKTLYVCTKHHKESVIRSVFQSKLPIKEVVSLDVDTDTLGTFSGEVERVYDPLTTLRHKVQMAPADAEFVIATEGSFGPHPSFFMLPAHDELILFYDRKNNIEIIERELTGNTNFQGKEIKCPLELNDFMAQVKFPEHGLIMMKDRGSLMDLEKGIRDINLAKETFERLLSKHGTCYIETDMRAHMNPTRMKVIEGLTQKLLDRIFNLCPECETPGFGVKQANMGLPCEICGMPTSSILSYTYCCVKCNFTDEVKYPKGQRFADATYCDHCNP